LDGPLKKLCPVIPTSNQDGRQAKNRKRGDEIKKKSSPLKLLSQSQPNFAEMILGWSPFKIVSVSSALRSRWPPQPNLAYHRTLWEIHITIFSSETTGPIAIKLLWNGPKLCPVIPTSNQDGHQAKNRKKGE
jgi:hypothetical protein